jgi:Domain of unknown function (DUF4386)
MTTHQTYPTPRRRPASPDEGGPRPRASSIPAADSDTRPTTRSPLAYARAAGLLYLVIFVCGVFSELVVRGSVIVPGDAAATADNILASEGLYRLGFVSDLVMLLADIGVAVLFYILLRPVSRTLALFATALRLTMDAVLGVNLLNHFAALLLLSDDGYLTAFDAEQRDALVLLSLEAQKYGYLVALVFFAVHVAVLGYLFYRSTYFPKLLGVLLGLAAVGYLADSLAFFLVPGYDGALSPVALAPVFVAEIAVILWLIVKGVDVPRWYRRAGLTAPAR